MSTSGTTTYSTSRNLIIEGALRILGVTAQGESPNSDMITEAASALNMMVKAWEADGMPLWATKEYSIPLTASVASYRIGVGQTINTPKPLRVLQAFLRNTSTNIDIPMRVLTRSEYNLLGNKAITGQPIQVYYDPQRVYGDLYVFPTPDSNSETNTQIHIIYQRPFEDFNSSTDEPDFPQEWFDALKFGLASRLAPEYGLGILERNDLKQTALQLKQEALNFGTEEGSLYFSVDVRDY